MIRIREKTELHAAPERVWRFFEQVEERYADWHREHLAWRWLSGVPLTPGAIWFADEWIGPLRVSGRFVVVRAESERLFAYRACFPGSLVGAAGSFRLTPVGDGDCRLVQEVRLGFQVALLGSVLDSVLARAVPLAELRRHMREEQRSLAAMLVEGGIP